MELDDLQQHWNLVGRSKEHETVADAVEKVTKTRYAFCRLGTFFTRRP